MVSTLTRAYQGDRQAQKQWSEGRLVDMNGGQDRCGKEGSR